MYVCYITLLWLLVTCAMSQIKIEDKADIKNFVADAVKSWTNLYNIDFIIYNDNYKRYAPAVNWPITILNVDKPYILTNGAIKYYYNYMMFSNCELISKTLHFLEGSYLWNYESSVRGKYLLFLFECNVNISEVFQTFWQRNIINVVAYIMDTNNSWCMTTYHPFSEESKCGQIIKPTLIKNLTEFTFAMYPTYLKHCKLNVSVGDRILPFAYFDKPHELITLPLLLLAERYGLNVTFFSSPVAYQIDPYGSQLLNIIQDVHNRKYDLTLATVMRQMNMRLLQNHLAELSDIVLFEEHLWFIPRTKKISPVMLLLIILPQDILLLILLTTTLAFVFWYIVCVIKNANTRIIELMGFMFGFSIPLPKAKIFAMLFVFYAIYGQHIAYLFQANLSSKLTVPQYEKRLKTVEDIVNSNLIIMLYEPERKALLHSQTSFAQRVYDKSNSFNKLIQRMKTVRENQSAVYTGSLSGLLTNYTLDHLNYIELVHDYDVLSLFEVQFIIGNGHPLLPAINSIISKVTEHGFIIKLFKVDALNYKIIESNQVVITVDHLQSIFVALVTGLSCALIVFIVELVVYKRSKKRQIHTIY